MMKQLTRRDCFRVAAGAAVSAGIVRGQAESPLTVRERAQVALIHGDERRRIVYESLKAIEKQIAPVLKQKQYVVIKPNNVSWRRQLASTHADALRGILDFIEPYRKPVVIAESCGDVRKAYETFHYDRLPGEYQRLNVKLVDLNEEGLYEVFHVLDANLHPTPVRLAKRLLDSDAFTICSAVMKTHNTVFATLSVKNMALGAPLLNSPKDTARWSDKRAYHGGVRQTHYDIMLTAQKLKPFWGATVIDGFEGMEGNGPGGGTPVDSRISIASADYIAADRVAVEVMGIDADWLGYLKFCHQVGVGQYDLGKIDIIGEEIAKVRKPYKPHEDVERELKWMGEMKDLPPRLG